MTTLKNLQLCVQTASDNYACYAQLYDAVGSASSQEIIGRILSKSRAVMDSIEAIFDSRGIADENAPPCSHEHAVHIAEQDKSADLDNMWTNCVAREKRLVDNFRICLETTTENDNLIELISHHKDAADIAINALVNHAAELNVSKD